MILCRAKSNRHSGALYQRTTRRRVRSRTLVLFVLCVTSVLCVVAGGGSAAARAGRESSSSAPDRMTDRGTNVAVAQVTSTRAHHYNMCSVQCAGQRPTSQAVIHYSVVVDNAWSLSLNEMCFSDANFVVNTVGLNGHWAYSDTTVPECPGVIDGFGNGVFTRYASDSAIWHQFFTQHVEPCVRGTDECRNMVCASMPSTPTGRLASCSAHLYPHSTSIAIDQAAEYIYVAQGNYGSIKRWLAGDFNLRPPDIPDIYHDLYSLGFVDFTFNAHGVLDRQLDYIWIAKLGLGTIAPRDPYCSSDASDHCYTSTEVRYP
jgi:hypothetical protein